MAGGEGGIGQLTPNEAAGKKHVNSQILKVDPDQLRRTAQQTHDVAISLQTHRVPLIEAKSEVVAEKAAFSEKWQPRAKYEQTHTKWSSSRGKYDAIIESKAKSLAEAASAMLWIADNFEKAEQANAEKMAKVDTDITEPTKPKKAPAPPSKPTEGKYA